VKDKKTIINLAPIPCPLSLPLTCGTHASDSSSTIPLRILPQRRTRGRPVLPLRCTTAAAAVARAAARAVFSAGPLPPPPSHGPPCTLRPPPPAAPSATPLPRPPSRWPSRGPPCAPRPSLRAAPSAAACPSRRRAGRRASRGPLLRGPCPPPQHAPAAVVLAAVTRAVPSAAQAGSSARRGV